MTGKILNFNGITRLDIPVCKIIDSAKKAKLDEIIILGFDKDGGYFFASSSSDGADVLWLLEMTKKNLLEVEI